MGPVILPAAARARVTGPNILPAETRARLMGLVILPSAARARDTGPVILPTAGRVMGLVILPAAGMARVTGQVILPAAAWMRVMASLATIPTVFRTRGPAMVLPVVRKGKLLGTVTLLVSSGRQEGMAQGSVVTTAKREFQLWPGTATTRAML